LEIIAEDLLYAELDLDGAQLPAFINRISSGVPVPTTRRVFLRLHHSTDSVAWATDFVALRPGLQAFLTYDSCASALVNIIQLHSASGHTLSHLQVWLDMKASETVQIVRLLPEFAQLRTLSITVCNGDTRQGRAVLADTPEIVHHGVTALTYFSYGASRAAFFGLLKRLSLPALAHVRLKVANARFAPTAEREFASLGQFFARHGSLAELRLSLETMVNLNKLLALPMSPRTLVLETAAETELRRPLPRAIETLVLNDFRQDFLVSLLDVIGRDKGALRHIQLAWSHLRAEMKTDDTRRVGWRDQLVDVQQDYLVSEKYAEARLGRFLRFSERCRRIGIMVSDGEGDMWAGIDGKRGLRVNHGWR
jgi:hypothetical protein